MPKLCKLKIMNYVDLFFNIIWEFTSKDMLNKQGTKMKGNVKIVSGKSDHGKLRIFSRSNEIIMIM